MKTSAISVLLFLFVITSFGALHTDTVEYKHGETVLEGYIAYDDATTNKRPGVIVVHEWKGLGDHAKKSAEKLAGLGYIALAIDMYGKGVRAKDNDEAGKLASIYKNDRKLMRARANAGLEALKQHSLTDTNFLGAIGYCFGGTTVLELARSGADLDGVVSFHGGLSTPTPEDAKNIKCKVLVLHGGKDPFVPPAEVAAFEEEMFKGGMGGDWQVISYGEAVHSFTNPEAGNDPAKGVAYHKEADEMSWEAMKIFFDQVLKE